MNYVGVAIAAMSAVFYIFVKSEVTITAVEKPENGNDEIRSKKMKITNFIMDSTPEKSFIDDLNPTLKRVIGIFFAVFSGVMYGLNYAPILYVIDNYEDASTNSLDYLYSFCSGTLVTSVVFLLIYCVVKKNKPIVYGNVMLPGFTAGCIWGIANACFLIASTSLSQAVIFPIGSYIQRIVMLK
jgi:hypothetical protein